jgi:diguanylate cyclase (GGDEF)-like protein
MQLTAVALVIAILAGATALGLLFYYTWKQREAAMHAEPLPKLLRRGTRGKNTTQIIPEFSALLVSALSVEQLWFFELRKEILTLRFTHTPGKSEAVFPEWRISEELTRLLDAEYDLFPIEALTPYLSEQMKEIIRTRNVNWWLPIFAEGNVYGLFLLSVPSLPQDAAKRQASLLAQLLSVTYRNETMTMSQPAEIALSSDVAKPTDRLHDTLTPSMFKLALRRGPESVVPVLVNTLKHDLGVEQLSLLFEHENKERVWDHSNAASGIVTADQSEMLLPKILSALTEPQGISIDELSHRDPELSGWVSEMRKQGYSWAVPFSISQEQKGVLIGSDTPSVQGAEERFTRAAGQAAHIVEVAEYSRQLHEMSYTDALTGLANHRYFRRRLDEEINRSHRYRRQLALIMFDVDDLKSMNDTHGHLAGDELLKQIAAKVRSCIRGIDLIARYGGDEFCIIMPEADEQTCFRFMGRLHRDMEMTALAIDGVTAPYSASISQGAAIFPTAGLDSKTLIHHADMAMIKAKNSGRNSYLLYSGDL